jgi:hypothetical protein
MIVQSAQVDGSFGCCFQKWRSSAVLSYVCRRATGGPRTSAAITARRRLFPSSNIPCSTAPFSGACTAGKPAAGGDVNACDAPVCCTTGGAAAVGGCGLASGSVEPEARSVWDIRCSLNASSAARMASTLYCFGGGGGESGDVLSDVVATLLEIEPRMSESA